MKKEDKDKLITFLPIVILVITVGIVTNYDILYTVIAGAIGGAIGYLILKLTKRK